MQYIFIHCTQDEKLVLHLIHSIFLLCILLPAGAYERRSREGACNSGSIQILISYVVPF